MSSILGQAQAEYGMCPFLGASYPVSSSPIASPNGGVTGSITVQGACIGPKCQLWDGSAEFCSLKNAFALPDAAATLLGIETELRLARVAVQSGVSELIFIRKGFGLFLEHLLEGDKLDGEGAALLAKMVDRMKVPESDN